MITASESDDLNDDLTAVADALGDDASMMMYVQLRPRWAAAARCKAELDALCRQHDAVTVSVAGLSQDSRYLRITLAIDLGSRLGIARFSEQATAAYDFTQSLFTGMFEYLPQYVIEPTADERDAALDLVGTTVRQPAVTAAVVAA